MSETAPTNEPAATGGSSAVAAKKQFPCRQCGADLTYAPGLRALNCSYCGFENHIPQSAEDIRERDFEQVLAELAEHAETVVASTVKCDACAAAVDLPEHATALDCPFCGKAIVATARSARRLKPKSLLPFKVPREQARTAFRTWLHSLWFAPAAIRHAAKHSERLKGMYVPYWTYDCNTTSHYSGMRGDHYYVTVGSGKNRRTERRKRWTPVSGVVFNAFDDVLVMASHSLPRGHADALEPWDLHELVPYADEYLSGFGSESYQIDLAGGFDVARGIMDHAIRARVCQDIGGDTQQVHDVRTQYDNITFKHILLPVWISAYRFRERVYRFLVNARTGEVQGQRPWSWIKITLTVLAAGAAIGGLVWMFQQ